jgi:hypothetical protein
VVIENHFLEFFFPYSKFAKDLSDTSKQGSKNKEKNPAKWSLLVLKIPAKMLNETVCKIGSIPDSEIPEFSNNFSMAILGTKVSP